MIDGPISRFVVDHRVAWLTSVMRTVSLLGSTEVLIAVIAVAGLALGLRRRSSAPLVLLAVAELGAIILYRSVKSLVARPRPSLGPVVESASGYAFPSGHATQAVVVWGAIAVLAIPTISKATGKLAVGAAAAAVALLVGVSRVYLGVHWTTDVLAGWTLGALWLTAICLATRWRRAAD